MWQAPNQRVRALANQRKRERDRNKKSFHVKRVTAHLKIVDTRTPEGGEGTPPELREVRLVINELSPKCVNLYGTAALNPGQDVVLELTDPAAISLPAKVLWCQRETSSHIISTDPHAFRILLEFKLATPEEQSAVKTFCDDIAKNQIFNHRAA